MSARNSSSVVVGRERCPSCAKQGRDTSKDNLVRYEDGHAWCYSCSYYVPPTGVELLQRVADEAKVDHGKRILMVGCPAGASCMSTDGNECKYCQEFDAGKDWRRSWASDNMVIDKNTIIMPYDATKTIDHRALEWLSKYSIERGEILANELTWCNVQQLLVFPIYDDRHKLIAYTARNFEPNSKAMKWHTRGPIHDIIHVIGYSKNIGKPVVVVEDIVSAIKVGRYAPTMCLFGSNMSLRQKLRLRNLSRDVVLWLDSDKYDEAMAIAKVLEMVNVQCDIVFTDADPKACSDQLIKQSLNIK